MSRFPRLLSPGIALVALSCGTVDAGQDFQFAEVVYDQNYFYCKVEPVLLNKNCGPGEPGTDAPGGCHFAVTTFRLQKVDTPIPCNAANVPQGRIPPEAQSNYQAAAREMTPDPDRASLLIRPLKRAAHPRQIFEENSDEAKIIRAWATKYTSQ